MQCSAEELADLSLQMPVIDVRSPREFARGHVPGAVSMPLFSDEERHEVGLLYAQSGRDAALKKGLEFAGPRLASMVETAERVSPHKKLLLYCWRGGMRSGSVSWLLRTAGFSVHTLAGGYKSWRRYALDLFSRPIPIVLIGGATGSGKTLVLRALQEHNEWVLDLEHEACHRGSAFGAIRQPAQPTQEHFENLCALQLHRCRHAARIWLEDESRSIGKVDIPAGLWSQMANAPVVHIVIPREDRVKNLVRDYGESSFEELHAAFVRIARRLSPERAAEADTALREGKYDVAADRCLHYYDKYYSRAIEMRDEQNVLTREYPSFDISSICQDILTHNKQLSLLIQKSKDRSVED